MRRGERFVHVCGRHAGSEQPPVSIDEDMALQSHECLAAAVTLHPSRFARFYRLTVYDGARSNASRPSRVRSSNTSRGLIRLTRPEEVDEFADGWVIAILS